MSEPNLPGVKEALAGVEQADPGEVFEGPAPAAPPTGAVPATPVPMQPTAPAVPAQDPSLIPDDPAELFTPDIGDYVDKDVLDMLHQQAKGGTSLGEVFGLAGLAMTNPDMARQLIAQKHGGVQGARALLTQLQSQISSQRKAMILASAADKKTENKIAADERKQVLQGRRETMKQFSADSGKLGVDFGAAPDVNDDKAWDAWEAGARSAVSKKQGENEKRNQWSTYAKAIATDLRALGKTPVDADFVDVAKSIAKFHGAPPELVDTIVHDPDFAKVVGAGAAELKRMNVAKSELMRLQGERLSTLTSQAQDYLNIAQQNADSRDYQASASNSMAGAMKATELSKLATLYDGYAAQEPDPEQKLRWTKFSQQATETAHKLLITAEQQRQRSINDMNNNDPRVVFPNVLRRHLSTLQDVAPDPGTALQWLWTNRKSVRGKALWDGVLADIFATRGDDDDAALSQWLNTMSFEEMRRQVAGQPFQQTPQGGGQPTTQPSEQ